MSLDSATRELLRQARDLQARARLLVEPVGHEGCASCGCPFEEWTLGCGTCSERHRAYDKRLHYPNGEKWYRAMREEHKQYHLQRRRDNGRASYA